MKPIIKVENIGKKYHIGGSKVPYLTLRDSIVETLKSPFKRRAENENSSFWALKNINFEIYPGEVVGIIGRNGAGKSTLLKILSRITEPTTGEIQLYGRIASLLEVGTGFHPELSGRENIYLNGAIVGMRRDEITKKFDEIVSFAEVEKFLDTPVKRYSSGMYVRLAFAVAAHLEPEILVIDEVLAVGDAEFQKKCLGKIDEVSKTGRTILFVSHQMGSVAQLCQKAIMLDKGSLMMMDKANNVIEYYVNQGIAKSFSYKANDSVKHREMYVESASIFNEDATEQNTFAHNAEIRINVRCQAQKMIRGTELRMAVKDGRGITVFTADVELDSLNEDTKTFEVDYIIPSDTLRPNKYSLLFVLFIPHQLTIELVEDVLFFSVYDAGTKYAQSEGMDYGLVFSPCRTSVKLIA